MSSIANAALRRATTEPTPLVHQAGAEVVLLLSAPKVNPQTRRLEAEGQHVWCGSAGAAREVAARALVDLAAFPMSRDRILQVSLERVEAARRFALRRAGRTH